MNNFKIVFVRWLFIVYKFLQMIQGLKAVDVLSVSKHAGIVEKLSTTLLFYKWLFWSTIKLKEIIKIQKQWLLSNSDYSCKILMDLKKK